MSHRRRTLGYVPITKPCVQCRQPLEFAEQPGDATCGACGTAQYVTAAGVVGRYPGDRLKPGPGL